MGGWGGGGVGGLGSWGLGGGLQSWGRGVRGGGCMAVVGLGHALLSKPICLERVHILGPSVSTVAIFAQGTHWAVATMQAFLSMARFRVTATLRHDHSCTRPSVPTVQMPRQTHKLEIDEI